MKTMIAVIMGSAVSPDGKPSRAMQRRVKAALDLRGEFEHVTFLPTGGNSHKWQHCEADVMKAMLNTAGVNDKTIIPEAESKNTLQSTINCARIIKKRSDVSAVIVCSDNFHLCRCRLLLSFLGIHSLYRPMPSGVKSIGWARWAYFCIRETVAIPNDLVLLHFFKILGKA